MSVDATPPPYALAALAALRRARLRAIELARATNTPLAIWRDGQVALIPPDELPVESSAESAIAESAETVERGAGPR